MMKHLSDEELNEYLDKRDPRLDAHVRAHTASCTECAARLDALDVVVSRLADAPRQAEPTRDLWDDIASRLTVGDAAAGSSRVVGVPPEPTAARIHAELRSRTRLSAIAWRFAAAITLFGAGLVAGRQIYAPRATAIDQVTSVAITTDSLEVAADVQAAGTRYAAAIARLAEVRSGSSFDQGWQAAIASLYAASRALAELSPTDADARAILHTVSRSHANRLLETPHRAQTSVRF